MDEKVLPIVQSDWVCEKREGMNTRIGRVRQSYFSNGQVCMDVVLYNLEGGIIGRESPAMGGPKTFEPAVEWDPEYWVRIEKPRFPIVSAFGGREDPERPGTKIMGYSIFTDEHNSSGVKIKAIRTTITKQSSDRMRKFTPVTPPKGNGLDVEIAALRRSAQELRDMAKTLDPSVGEVMKARAKALETEALELVSG